jgi:hypothetical protein
VTGIIQSSPNWHLFFFTACGSTILAEDMFSEVVTVKHTKRSELENPESLET